MTNEEVIGELREAFVRASKLVRDEALEEAARLCDERQRTFEKPSYPGHDCDVVVARAQEAYMCANEIRRLKVKP